jgi:hypothetical protein
VTYGFGGSEKVIPINPARVDGRMSFGLTESSKAHGVLQPWERPIDHGNLLIQIFGVWVWSMDLEIT